MAKDEEVEWRRMRRLNGEGSRSIFILIFILPFLFLFKLRFSLKSSPKVFGVAAVTNYVARLVVKVVFYRFIIRRLLPPV